MVYSLTCATCGDVVTFFWKDAYPGWYTCPLCNEKGLFVPETKLSPGPKPAGACEPVGEILPAVIDRICGKRASSELTRI